jgi:hypothetical protein
VNSQTKTPGVDKPSSNLGSANVAGRGEATSRRSMDQIRRACYSARPTQENPAFINCHADCVYLLEYITRLGAALRELVRVYEKGDFDTEFKPALAFAESILAEASAGETFV